MRMMTILRMLLLVAVTVSAAESARAADDALSNEPGLDELLKQGIVLRRSGNDEAALAVFLDLEKRAPDSVRLLLHITTAAQAAGKWTMAYDYLQKAASHKDDPYYQRYRAAIENVEKSIVLRVGQFRARGTPAGAEVRLNGDVVGILPMTNVRPIEIGSYMLEVNKAGFYPLRRPITITAGGGLIQEAVELRERNSGAASAATDPTASDGRASADAGARPGSSWWRSRWVTWTLVGAGVAAAATSGIAFAIREQKAGQWNDDSRCLSSTNVSRTRQEICGTVHDDLKVAEGIAVTAGIAALTFGGAALVHGLSTPRDTAVDVRAGAQSAQTKAGCSPGLASIVCYGSF